MILDAIIPGIPSPASYVPSVMTTYSDRMSFWERMQNLRIISTMTILDSELLTKGQLQVYLKTYW